jgi:hypothetical protein
VFNWCSVPPSRTEPYRWSSICVSTLCRVKAIQTMGHSVQVGSLDEWLSKAPLSSERHSSPFAVFSHGVRSSHAKRSTFDGIRSQGSQGSQLVESSRLLHTPSAMASPSLTVELLGAGRLHDDEGTVRYGRLRPAAGPRSDAQPISRAPGSGTLYRSAGFMESAASLPIRMTPGRQAF